MEALTADRCTVCDLPFQDGTSECRNVICKWDYRYFDWNYAAAMRSGVLERAINRYKYDEQKGWAVIFARVLLGFLAEQRETFEHFQLIVASPNYCGSDEQSRTWDHTREVLRAAHERSDGEWPFDVGDPPAIVKTAPTERMVKAGTWKKRREIAEGPLRAALCVPDRSRIAGKNVLVYDDVFTGGLTLREVARCLKREGGAARVCGVSLARQRWGSRS